MKNAEIFCKQCFLYCTPRKHAYSHTSVRSFQCRWFCGVAGFFCMLLIPLRHFNTVCIHIGSLREETLYGSTLSETINCKIMNIHCILYCRRMLRKTMTYWKKYIPLTREEEKREKRRSNLRKHVLSLLPDFQTSHHSPQAQHLH